MSLPYSRIHVVINPASGKNQPILNTLNDVFHPAGVRWEVSITHQAGDGARQAREAAAAGADLVAAYGGDGTQMEVANGLLGTGVPQAILPGGTGNVMAYELGLPVQLREAAQLIVTSQKRRAIDLARMGERVFMLRSSIGFKPETVANRELKDKYGSLAYIQAYTKFVLHMSPTQYYARVDGEDIECKALICFILNAGSLGGVLGMNLPAFKEVNISDGFLDLYAITRDLEEIRSLPRQLLQIENTQAGIYHWRGKEITLKADPPQDIWVDGETAGKTPQTATVIPQALEIVVPE